jgi:protein-tyrosine phosphatase
MAEYLLRDLARRRGLVVEVRSAGTHAVTGAPPTPDTIAVLQEWGIDASRHRSQPLCWELLDWADVILTMTRDQKEYLLMMDAELCGRVFTLPEYVGLAREEVSDPYGNTREAYRKVRDQLADLVQRLVAQWVGAAAPAHRGEKE